MFVWFNGIIQIQKIFGKFFVVILVYEFSLSVYNYSCIFKGRKIFLKLINYGIYLCDGVGFLLFLKDIFDYWVGCLLEQGMGFKRQLY